jgi:hypothetical protein
VDQVIFQYPRAAQELWKFCNLGRVKFTARQVDEDPPIHGGSAERPGRCQTRRPKPDRESRAPTYTKYRSTPAGASRIIRASSGWIRWVPV